MPPTQSTHDAFYAAMGRSEALHTAQRLARHTEEALVNTGYHGPVAVCGGYVRDIALARSPKDLDVFLDSAYVRDRKHAEMLGAAIAIQVKGARVSQIMASYGTWAKDVDVVVKVRLDLDNQELAWLDRCPIPAEVDLIVLRHQALRDRGYEHRLTNDAYNQECFLKACLARVDLRLNALGATPAFTHSHPEWDFDAYYNRLVVQYAKHDDLERINKRLKRLGSEKFPNWTQHYELSDGTLQDHPYESSPVGHGD